MAGGTDIFDDRARCGGAKDRIVSAKDVIARQPDLIIGSWWGKRFRPERVAARPGFADIPAARHGAPPGIKSSLVLQPGPPAPPDGLASLEAIIGTVPRAPRW